VGDAEFEVGSGNVFADLGLDNPDERKAKSALAAEINAIIEAKGWTQAEAAERLETHQPVISALRHGRLKSLTYDRLVHWLVMLGRTVEIRVTPAKKAHVEVAIAAG
jgi:predicted XRE-type DNA-binding protein